MNNKIFVAAAGSGKTSLIVDQALQVGGRVLITTYTIENSKQIRDKIMKKCRGIVPNNITIQTWFSFLLEHGVKPYQNYITKVRAEGVEFVSGTSARYEKSESDKHFFNKNNQIYSDKLSKFTLKVNEKSKGKVTSRLEMIFSHIFIDEVQDMAGYDLDFIQLLFKTKITTICVGDPRQVTYETSHNQKNKQYAGSKKFSFFEDRCEGLFELDVKTLSNSHRNNCDICAFSSKIYPDLSPTYSNIAVEDENDGVFLITNDDLEEYLSKFKPMQLRYNIKADVNQKHSVMNFGDSKGLEFRRVIIYPTMSIKKWILDNEVDLSDSTRARFYVATTRAFDSVAIVVDKIPKELDGLKNYKNK